MLAMVRDLSLPDEKVPLLLPIASLKRNYEAASPVDVFLYQTQRHGFMAFCRAQTTWKVHALLVHVLGGSIFHGILKWLSLVHPWILLCGTIPSPSWQFFLEKTSCLQRQLCYHPGQWQPAVLRKWPHIQLFLPQPPVVSEAMAFV